MVAQAQVMAMLVMGVGMVLVVGVVVALLSLQTLWAAPLRALS